ncbi:OLC1v1024134C1 [Oldenlandia corymbosa var. corymbosa]|uniref:OLC1v1024134C1 n=1 Tax=Oldenlandia corymbosa var. corymbosa TaxID=529605 RepID=A0AAV1C4E7_OLDCO|nr:OLC1v1024134C1 [Oldenlandia corymbosa var. corymbosa]
MEVSIDWSSLLPDLLSEIAIRIHCADDFMAFRGVCTSWRAVATKDKFVPVTTRSQSSLDSETRRQEQFIQSLAEETTELWTWIEEQKVVASCHTAKLKEISSQMEEQRAMAATHTAPLNEIGAQLKSLAAVIDKNNFVRS